jgi:hypothetical protein
VYGGYSPNEYTQWFDELAINLQDRTALRRIFRDPGRPVHISATIQFAEDEKAFMLSRAADLAWPLAWGAVTGQTLDYWSFSRMAIATQLAQYKEPVEQKLGEIIHELEQSLSDPEHLLSLTVNPDGTLNTENCTPAQVSFQAYQPEDLGIIEYHGANRSYPRQAVAGINLDTRAFDDQRRQQTLYNAGAKYQNVKSELATGYLRSLIAERAGTPLSSEDLNETLRELFKIFFPDKTYEGVRPLPGGSLEFPVRLPGGEEHDIDDLSSGEKEILYGYLRLRNATPRQSVILLDEPELHLNPALLQGFADFYYRHIGVAQGNQLWMVTHSDTLLRQAVGNTRYGVYHMLTATSSNDNQATEVYLGDEVERGVVDLVGDLAAYRPHAKVVILEGDSQGAFDETMVRRLFPDIAKRINVVSGGAKRRVRDLHEILSVAVARVGTENRFFSIVDRDTDVGPIETAHVYRWDVYHIENFLLWPPGVREATNSLTGRETFASDEDVLIALRECAQSLVANLVLVRLQSSINATLVAALNIGAPRGTSSPERDLLPSIEGSVNRLTREAANFTQSKLEQEGATIRQELDNSLDSDDWMREFPGRDVLKAFVNRHIPGVAYEPFRNLILDKMAQSEYKPDNITQVLQQVLNA